MSQGKTQRLDNPAQANQESTSLTIVTQEQMALTERVLGSIGVPNLNNFDGDKMNQYRLTALANSPDALDAKALGETAIEIRYFHAKQVELMGNAPGEITGAIRVALITHDGKVYAFVSDGVAASLGELVQLLGYKPWPAGMPIKLRQIKTRRGFYTYRLVPA